MEGQIHTWLLVRDHVKHPQCRICCSVASQLALGKPISTFIYQLAASLKMPWWKGIPQPDMSLLVTFHGTSLHVYNAFTWSPSVSVSLSSCLPAVSLSKLAGFTFFHYSKEHQGQPLLNCFGPFSFSLDKILLLIPVPHILLWALLASVIRIIWRYHGADHSWSQQPGMRLLGGNNFTRPREQKKKRKELGFFEITEHPVFH